MTRAACVGEPISWLRLEAFALGLAAASTSDDAEARAIAQHLARCPTCTRCLAEIRGDAVALPALPAAAPAPAARRRWWTWAAPAMALAAAAAVVLVLVRDRGGDREALAPDTAAIKGVGLVHLEVVRERDGAIRTGARSFAPGDRWKLVVTCAPDRDVWVDAAVLDGASVDHPLAPARLACGNRVAVPGAFTLAGAAPHLLCVRLAAGDPPPRTPAPRAGDPGVACVTVDPE